MIGLIQRTTTANVEINGQTVGSIGHGLLALVAIEPQDTEAVARQLIDRIVAYRVFDDGEGRMNRSLVEVGGELLLVSQFTLAADTRKGLRPSFTGAAPPELGRRLFESVVEYARARLPGRVACGRFGAAMRVSLVNDGPVTFWLQVPPRPATE